MRKGNRGVINLVIDTEIVTAIASSSCRETPRFEAICSMVLRGE
jgi:hypothetical protein